MAPAPEAALEAIARSVVEHDAGLAPRDLQNPTHTQQVTLGVIAAYVVGIAILWNVPYLRMILWPFKVSYQTSHAQDPH
jgi:hypothetical protein